MKIYPNRWAAVYKQFGATAGFTLLELIVIILIISLLFAIVAPGWAALVNTQRLNAAQESVLQAMRAAQIHAKQSHLLWQASFQDANGNVQWVVHPASDVPVASLWQSLDRNVQLDEETTLQQAGGLRRVQFDHKGHINGQLGRLTLSGKAIADDPSHRVRRCVIVSTLLGVIRTGKEHATMQDGKYCY